jgi:hypothetical protein
MGWSKKHCLIGIFVLLAVCQLPAAGRAALVAHWTFDEAPGATQVVDTVGGLEGNLSATGATLVSGGRSGGALSLDRGTGGYVTMGDILNLGTGPYSFVVWIKTSSGDSETAIVTKHWATVTAGYYIGLNEGNTYGSSGKAWFYNLSPASSPISSTDVNDGSWRLIIGVRGNNQVKIYVDGVPVESVQVDQGLGNPPTGTAFMVGGYTSSGGAPVSTGEHLYGAYRRYPGL